MPGWVSGIGDGVVRAVFVGTGMVPRSHTQTCSALLHSGRGGQGPSLSQNTLVTGCSLIFGKDLLVLKGCFGCKADLIQWLISLRNINGLLTILGLNFQFIRSYCKIFLDLHRFLFWLL